MLTIESGDRRLARTVIDRSAAANTEVLTLDSMQATAQQDIQAGASYLGIMESNLDILKQALR